MPLRQWVFSVLGRTISLDTRVLPLSKCWRRIGIMSRNDLLFRSSVQILVLVTKSASFTTAVAAMVELLESSSRFSHIEGREEDDLRLEGVILGRHVILAPWQNSDTHSHRDRRTQYFLLLRFAHFEIFPRINFECTAQHLKLYTPGHCENSRCSTFSFKQFCEVYDNKISTFLCPLYFIWLLDSSNWLFPRTF